MVQTHELTSGWSTGKGAPDRTYVDDAETIGSPRDARASAVNSSNSAFAYLKGICSVLGVADGSGAGVTNTATKVYHDPEVTLGLPTDARATDTNRQSAISLLKGMAAAVGVTA